MQGNCIQNKYIKQWYLYTSNQKSELKIKNVEIESSIETLPEYQSKDFWKSSLQKKKQW